MGETEEMRSSGESYSIPQYAHTLHTPITLHTDTHTITDIPHIRTPQIYHTYTHTPPHKQNSSTAIAPTQ